MIFVVVVTCWIGIAAFAAVAAGASVEEDDEIESLAVAEGENLTINIHIEKWDEDPQVLVTRLKGSSQERIAQMICHNGACEHECWRSGVSLISDRDNVSLILMNVCYNQTGLYKVHKHSNKRLEKKIYNVTVYEPPLSTIIPEKTASAKYREYTAGISAVAVSVLLVLAVVVIIASVVYRKRRKANIDEATQEITEVSRYHRSHSDHASYL